MRVIWKEVVIYKRLHYSNLFIFACGCGWSRCNFGISTICAELFSEERNLWPTLFLTELLSASYHFNVFVSSMTNLRPLPRIPSIMLVSNNFFSCGCSFTDSYSPFRLSVRCRKEALPGLPVDTFPCPKIISWVGILTATSSTGDLDTVDFSFLFLPLFLVPSALASSFILAKVAMISDGVGKGGVSIASACLGEVAPCKL